TRSRLRQRVEHSLKVERRAADDLQHLGGCRLLGTSLLKLGRTLGELAFQLGDICLIDIGRHLGFHPLPALACSLPWILERGRTTRNSVNAPGSVSTSIAPPCCLTMMSWLIDSPRPVPSPAGLVVKKGLNIFSFTCDGMPVPLSRMRISTWSPCES